MLTVTEIFHSIQGESSYAGLPCVFVRLTGCDLRCSWCDTAYAFHEGRRREVDEVMEEVASYGCRLVEVTGGEPLLQADVYLLLQRLLDAGYQVLVETGGHVPVDLVPEGVVRIMDVKCPGSGASEAMDPANIGRLRPQDEVKFVLGDRSDYEWARDFVRRHSLATRCHAVLFSPVFGRLPAKEVAQWILDDGLPVRVQVQLHKLLGMK